MWPLVTYSNYFEMVTTVTFLDLQMGLISGTFLFKTVILYHIHYNTRYNICSTWFLWNLMLTLNGVNEGRACALVLRYVIDDVMSVRALRSQLSIARSV